MLPAECCMLIGQTCGAFAPNVLTYDRNSDHFFTPALLQNFSLVCILAVAKMSTDRNTLVERAKLAEQAERYEDMAKVGIDWSLRGDHVLCVLDRQPASELCRLWVHISRLIVSWGR